MNESIDPEVEGNRVNIIPVFERRLGFLESEIVQRDIQIEMMGQEIARLTALLNPEVPEVQVESNGKVRA